jgi:hypothetical protein
MISVVLGTGMSFPTIFQMVQQSFPTQTPLLAYVALNIIRHWSYLCAVGEGNIIKLNG